eukprot:199563-Pelagomonas_calceolata.AAC.2
MQSLKAVQWPQPPHLRDATASGHARARVQKMQVLTRCKAQRQCNSCSLLRGMLLHQGMRAHRICKD